MALEPSASIGTGLAVAGVVYAIHSNMTPTTADIQALPAGNKDVDKAEKKATWLGIGIVSGISLLAKDPTIFVLGSFAVIGMAFVTRHANWTETATGMLNPMPGQTAVTANDLSTGPEMMEIMPFTSTSQFVSS
jgi:hypothetical protein